MKARFRHLPIVLILLLALAPGASLCAEDGAVLLTGDVQLKIADAFLEEGEYYRAVTEYKKFLILFPDSARADYASYAIGLAHFKGEEFGTAARNFSALRQKFPASGYAVEAAYLEGISHWRQKNYSRAQATLEALADEHPATAYAPRALLAICLAALDEDKAEQGGRALERVLDRYPDYPDRESVRQAAALVGRYQDLPEKSPVLAGILSAVLPGSGYIYAEHYGDGITAFLVNGLFIAGTAAAIHQENYAVAGIVGGVGAPFYLGNIYGSANAARKWNRRIRNEITREIRSILDPLL